MLIQNDVGVPKAFEVLPGVRETNLAGREETMAAGRVANRHMSKRNLNYRIVKQANDRSQRPHPAQA